MSRALLILVLLFCAFAAPAEEVAFTLVSPLSGNQELMRRLLSRDEAAAIAADLAQSGKRLADQPVDPSREHFALYVPPEVPPGGYALLVFVPPWQQLRIPRGWEEVLDRLGVIYVSAGQSGNEESTNARREPLALIAAANVMARYPVDPARIFIGGFSGGSRVAERLALGYPDLFRGAVLEAGSDRVDERDLPLPPDDLLRRFQEDSRLVFVTGENDSLNRRLDGDTMQSLEGICQFGFASQTVPWLGHAILPPGALELALRTLLNPSPLDRVRLEECRAGSMSHAH
jgi:poly(3-hydroxybutyrate) depolymerase